MNISRFALLFIAIAPLISCVQKKGNATAETKKHEPVLNLNLFPEEGLTDPHTIVKDGRLYVFCGHDQSWDTEDTWKMDRWEIRSTSDLINWRKDREILPTETYIGDKPNCWAGDITERNGKFYWYFSNRNISTGVMVADSPEGPYVDALGKPLLPNGIIGKGHPYDPEIFVEDGVYTMFFASGHYYAVTLAEDMISLADEPQPIIVKTKDGKNKWTADKSTLFKRNNIYYLAWGGNYAMSDNLRGPYTYEGQFLSGGHNNVFQWEGQWYAVMENKDIGLFYRGVSLKPLYFNDDGTVKVPADDKGFPHGGRKWEFERSRMAWRAVEGEAVEWDNTGHIKGNINGNTILESAVWAGANLDYSDSLVIRLKNKSAATKAKVLVATYKPENAFWEHPEIEWKKEIQIEFEITPNDTEYKEYAFNLAKYPNKKQLLKRLRIEPALNATTGSWEIEYISVQ